MWVGKPHGNFPWPQTALIIFVGKEEKVTRDEKLWTGKQKGDTPLLQFYLKILSLRASFLRLSHKLTAWNGLDKKIYKSISYKLTN